MNNQNIEIYGEIEPIYDLMHGDRSIEFEFYRKLLLNHASQPNLDALEVACGNGLLAAKIVDVCAHYSGLDASPEMLNSARSRLPQATWIAGDMRNFDLGRRFDAVICPFNSLQHLEAEEDFQAALLNFVKHCQPEGLIAFDIFNPSPIYTETVRKDAFVASFRHPVLSEIVEMRQDTRFDSETDLLTIEWRLSVVSSGDLITRSSCTMRQFWPDDLDRLLKDLPLGSIDVFGGFDWRAFSPECTKQIIVAKRI